MTNDPIALALLVTGFLLVMGGAIAITTFGKRYPLAVLCTFMFALAVYVSIILVRLGIISWPGATMI